MSNRRRWGGSGVALLLFVAACGGGENGTSSVEQSTPGTSTPPPSPAGTTAAARFPGEPPGSPATIRLDEIMARVTLPPGVTVLQRQDLTNESAAGNNAEVAGRFRDNGRETGVLYVLGVEGQPRIQMGINQYARPEGARGDFESIRPAPGPDDAIEAAGLGDDRAAARVAFGSDDARAFFNNIVFMRGRYVVTMAEITAGPDAPADTALALAYAVDAQLRAAGP